MSRLMRGMVTVVMEIIEGIATLRIFCEECGRDLRIDHPMGLEKLVEVICVLNTESGLMEEERHAPWHTAGCSQQSENVIDVDN